jgi:hypothetical protein
VKLLRIFQEKIDGEEYQHEWEQDKVHCTNYKKSAL